MSTLEIIGIAWIVALLVGGAAWVRFWNWQHKDDELPDMASDAYQRELISRIEGRQ